MGLLVCSCLVLYFALSLVDLLAESGEGIAGLRAEVFERVGELLRVGLRLLQPALKCEDHCFCHGEQWGLTVGIIDHALATTLSG